MSEPIQSIVEQNTDIDLDSLLMQAITQKNLQTFSNPEDPVNHPAHYTKHASGVECIQITEHMGFCLGNAIKYIWRADLKNDALEDLKKAMWYLEREIALRESRR